MNFDSRKGLLTDPEFGAFVGEQRGESVKSRIFDFDSNNLEREDIKTKGRSNGSAVFTKTDSMTDDEFETYKSEAKESGLNFDGGERGWGASKSTLDDLGAPNPARVAQERSDDALENDRNRRAQLTTDVETYASDPNRYDFPGIDTPDEYHESASKTGTGRVLRFSDEQADEFIFD